MARAGEAVLEIHNILRPLFTYFIIVSLRGALGLRDKFPYPPDRALGVPQCAWTLWVAFWSAAWGGLLNDAAVVVKVRQWRLPGEAAALFGALLLRGPFFSTRRMLIIAPLMREYAQVWDRREQQILQAK